MQLILQFPIYSMIPLFCDILICNFMPYILAIVSSNFGSHYVPINPLWDVQQTLIQIILG